MSITSIRKSRLPYKGGPGAIGVRFDPVNNLLKIHDGVVERVVQTSQSGLTVKTADYTVVLPTDRGKRIAMTLLAGITVTLPAVSAANKGQHVTFINALLPTSGSGYAISPNASDRIGYKADDADLVNTAATDALADFVTLESDGVDGWIIVGYKGIWA